MPTKKSKIQPNFHFKTLEDGTKIFYPQGALGRRGYYVPSPELESKLRQDLRRLLRRQMLWTGALGGYLGALAMFHIWMFISIILFWVSLEWLQAHLHFAKYTKEMEPAHIANSPIAHWSQWGESAHPAILIGYMMLWLVLIGGCLWLYIRTNLLQMLLCIVLFVLMLVPSAIAIYSKWFTPKTH